MPSISVIIRLSRPFTLLAPALGMLCGGLTAWGAAPRFTHVLASDAELVLNLLIGSVGAALLNAGSNVLNQITDRANDAINKPERPLITGEATTQQAALLSAALYAVALMIAWGINLACFTLFAAAALATVVYSVPPLRTKRFGWLANFTIAVPRGALLKVAGWSLAKDALEPEAWLIGGLYFLFLLGATSAKDFADIEGDRAAGCETLPVKYGPERAARIIYPFFTLPFLLLIPGALTGVFTGNTAALIVLALLLAVIGHFAARSLGRYPAAQLSENHPAWRGMYLMMVATQLGLAAAYLV